MRNTQTIARLAKTLQALGRSSKQIRASVILMGAGPSGFEGDVAHLQQACDALCRISRVERAYLTDHTAVLDREHEASVRQDLRGHAATIKGYAELILEELAADLRIVVSQETEDVLAALVQQAEELLPHIDALRSNMEENITRRMKVMGPKAQNPLPERIGAPRALIVDDDEPTRMILGEHLKTIGLETIAADSGRAALKLLETNAVDIVLCDILMKDTSGYEVLRGIKDNPAIAGTPVMMISSIDTEDSVAMCLESGASDYITKPFNPRVFLARVQACRRSQESQMAELVEARAHRDALAGLMAGIESISDGFAIFDDQRQLKASNRSFREVYPDAIASNGKGAGISLDQLLRHNWDRGLYRADKGVEFDEWSRLRLSRHDSAKPHMERLTDGRWIQFDHNHLPSGGVVVQLRSISRQDRDKERLWYLHFHDQITALPNAALFGIQLQHSMGESDFVLLTIAVNGWLEVREERGEDIANPLLKRAAESLLSSVRAGDLVAHLGGQRFAIILDKVGGLGLAVELGRRICVSLKQALNERDGGEKLQVSAGLALHPSMGKTPDALLRAAAGLPIDLTA